MVKNPNWQEADQLAIYKRSWGVELGTTENTTPAKWSERDLNPQPLAATNPPQYLNFIYVWAYFCLFYPAHFIKKKIIIIITIIIIIIIVVVVVVVIIIIQYERMLL